MFDQEQRKYMIKIGLHLDFDNLSDDDIVMIDDVVGDRLMMIGFDKDYEPNWDGRMCESILDVIGEQ